MVTTLFNKKIEYNKKNIFLFHFRQVEKSKMMGPKLRPWTKNGSSIFFLRSWPFCTFLHSILIIFLCCLFSATKKPLEDPFFPTKLNYSISRTIDNLWSKHRKKSTGSLSWLVNSILTDFRPKLIFGVLVGLMSSISKQIF